MRSEESLAGRARAAAASYRLGMEGSAGERLAALVDALLAEIARRPALGARVALLLREIVAAQTRRDPIGLADRLEHELAPLLD